MPAVPSGPAHLPHAAVKVRQRVGVREVDDRRGHKCAGHLRADIRGDLGPRKPAPGRQRDGDRRIEVRARHAGRHVDAHRDGQTPRQVDRQVLAGGAAAERDLGDHAHAKQDQHERAQKLRQRLAHRGRHIGSLMDTAPRSATGRRRGHTESGRAGETCRPARTRCARAPAGIRPSTAVAESAGLRIPRPPRGTALPGRHATTEPRFAPRPRRQPGCRGAGPRNTRRTRCGSAAVTGPSMRACSSSHGQ